MKPSWRGPSRRRCGVPHDGEQVGTPFGGEAGDAVRAEHARRQLVADLDVVPPALAVAELVHHVDVFELAHSMSASSSSLHPDPRSLVIALISTPDRGDSGCGRALLGEQLAVLVVVIVVAALEAGRTGELGLLDDIVEGNLLVDGLSPSKSAAVEPPFIATEDQMRLGNAADAGRCGAMPVVGRNREGLRRDESAESAYGGTVVIVVQPVRIVHCMRPAAEVIVVQVFLQAPGRQ